MLKPNHGIDDFYSKFSYNFFLFFFFLKCSSLFYFNRVIEIHWNKKAYSANLSS